MDTPLHDHPIEPDLEPQALRRVLHVARLLGASSDLDEILGVIIDAIRDGLDAERATVFEYDRLAGELFATVAHGLLATDALQERGAIRSPLGRGIVGETARSRCVVNVPDAYADPRFNPAIDRQTGFRTRNLLSIPLVSGDELVGAIQVLNKRGGAFSGRDEELALALASQAAIAIRRARLLEDRLVREKLERDLALARVIQQKTLPWTLPRLPGFEVAAWSESADETGGDTYDVVGYARTEAGIELVDPAGSAPRALLLLADASGHGVGPALSVTQLRAMVRMGIHYDDALRSLACHINGQLHRDLPPGSFVTAWLAVVDARTGVLESYSCGQAPLVHYQAATNTVRLLESNDAPLGLVPILAAAEPVRVPLEPGDAFVVLSDGLYEAFGLGGHQALGIDPIAERVVDAAGSAVGIVAAVREVVAQHAGHVYDDDRTALVIRRLCAGEREEPALFARLPDAMRGRVRALWARPPETPEHLRTLLVDRPASATCRRLLDAWPRLDGEGRRLVQLAVELCAQSADAEVLLAAGEGSAHHDTTFADAVAHELAVQGR